MKFVIVLEFCLFLLLLSENEACFPGRSRGPLHSYLPATIQILHHYKEQLRRFYPYAFSNVCRFGNSRKPKRSFGESGLSKMAEDQQSEHGEANNNDNNNFLLIPRGADFCVFPTDTKLTRLLRNLHREAHDKNLEEFQGFSYRILLQLEKTTNMTSADQLYFIFDRLIRENIVREPVKCAIVDLMYELREPNSKLSRNLMLVKSLSYVTWR